MEIRECIKLLIKPNTIEMIKSKKTRLAGNIARTAHKILVKKKVAIKPHETHRPAGHLDSVTVSSGQVHKYSVSIKYRELLDILK
jgi:hypothetical protein